MVGGVARGGGGAANGGGNQRAVVTRFVVADAACDLEAVVGVVFKRQHVGLPHGVLPVPRGQQVGFAIGRAIQLACGVLNVLHTGAAAVGFAFGVHGIQCHAQFFAAVIGVQGEFFVVFFVAVARGVAVAQFGVGADAELFAIAKALPDVGGGLQAAVAEPCQAHFAVALVAGFFGFNVQCA